MIRRPSEAPRFYSSSGFFFASWCFCSVPPGTFTHYLKVESYLLHRNAASPDSALTTPPSHAETTKQKLINSLPGGFSAS